MINYFKKFKNRKGFTIIELIVSIGIFAMMSALLLAKYGTFNQGVILTNLAYDVALTIRNAQSYGLNVRSASRSQNAFDYNTDSTLSGGAYGVHFSKAIEMNDKFQFFVDLGLNPDGIYQVSEELSETTIQRGSKVGKLCIGDVGSQDCTITTLDISFKRPDPNAIIRADGATTQIFNAEIILEATDGSTKTVQVNSTGQISVK